MEAIKRLFIDIKNFLDVPVTKIGSSEITLWLLLYFICVVFILAYVTGKLRKWIVFGVLSKSKIDLGIRIAVGTIIRYIVLVIGLVIILQSVGIDLSTFTILAGALGVGIGFGLQNITNNFVSGIIILFERPIKVGDRIEVDDISGDVVRISMRSTTIITNDNIAIIVPNSEFVSSKVINWSYNDRSVRFNFPVNVSYKEDPEKIKNLLIEIAINNKGVLKEPKPDVLFDKFGDSSLIFNLRVWTREYINRPGVLRSQLYYTIFSKFRENNIEIPFSQMDIHFRDPEIKSFFSSNNERELK